MLAKRVRLISFGLILFAASTLASAAGAPRTFVASNGSDASPCSITAPCRGFAAAESKTNAGGEVIVQDSAGYGPVVITKSISIIAPPGIYAGVTVSSGNGITVNAPGATVVLRGLSINGQGGAIGILAQQAARIRIEKCIISNMGAQGIYHQANNAEMIVLDTISRDNGDGGVALVAQDASIVMDHVRSERNVNVGFYIAPTAGSSMVSATIVDSVFAYNGSIGIWADTVGSVTTFIIVERTIMSSNGSDGFFTNAGASNAISKTTLRSNTFNGNHNWGVHLVATFGLALATAVDNIFTDNFSGSGDGGAVMDGGNAVLTASRNTGQSFGCLHFGGVDSYQDNSVASFSGCQGFPANPH